MKQFQIGLLIFILLLSACSSQTEAVLPTSAPATATGIPPTETQTPVSFTATPPAPTASPTIFGAILQTEIQAFALEPVANAIFTKVMDGFIADGGIQEYLVIGVTIFPGNGGLLSEISFDVRTIDSAWLESDGTQAADNWITGKCYRFDFVTTETEFQLKNRRTCN